MIRFTRWTGIALCFAALLPVAYAQRKRITVLPLRDRTNSGASLNISQKVADELMSKLAETGQFQVFTRENLSALSAERGLKYDADFDPKNAPRSGLLKVCDYLVTGEIVEFSQNQTSATKSGVFNKNTEVDGTAALKILVNVTSVETGELVTVAESRSEQSAPLTKSGGTVLPSITSRAFKLPSTGTSNVAGDTDKRAAMLKLVDADVAAVSGDVAQKIAEKTAGANAAAAAAIVPSFPQFVGMSEGLAMISRGSNSGIKVGQTFEIVHVTDTGLKNPESGKPIVKRVKVCTLTITSVEEDSAGGKCPGATPKAGDELRGVNQ